MSCLLETSNCVVDAVAVLVQGGIGGAAGGGEVSQPECLDRNPHRQQGAADARQLCPRHC